MRYILQKKSKFIYYSIWKHFLLNKMINKFFNIYITKSYFTIVESKLIVNIKWN